MSNKQGIRRALLGAALIATGLGLGAETASAQWSQAYEQFYLPADHNWEFRENYVNADRLFNAFDYGHSILYEELYTKPGAPVERLEEKEFDFLTRKLLRNPPRVPLEEGAIEIAYAKLAPEAKEMFHWAHILHRQAYDIWADEDLSLEEKDRAMAELLAYYKSRPDVAFSSLPKSMELMDGQYYSLGFREKYPKFNGLIWAYHWLQVGLYEPLLVGETPTERKALVDATVARFWQMIENAPENMPYLMPMTAAVAPEFSKRYPEVAIIFDNLHMMHDVVSDILVSPKVPREKKREEILRAARLFSDDTSYVITPEQWWEMAQMMGVNNMGGPAVGFLAALPQPTVPRGMSMAGMDHSRMDGMQHGQMQHGNMQHGQTGAQPMGRAAMGHAMPRDTSAGHAGMQHGAMPGMMDAQHMQRMHEMHMRMMADPVIRERVRTDPELSRMMREMEDMMPSGHSMHGASGATVSASDREQAMDFVVRLLSDPAVEARIHSDPQLHQLWSDPEVQRRLAELRKDAPAAAKGESAHRH
jgi:hypothetical protein